MKKACIALLLLLVADVARAQGDADRGITQIYEEEIEQALVFAPRGMTKYQLRGEAQKTAQALLDYLADEHGYPPYKIGGIMFQPIIILPDGGWGAAAAVDGCDYPPYRITINEILFYRNYYLFIEEAIPHEVAHIAACLKSNPHGKEHGPEWEEAMRALGYLNPHNMTRHGYDLSAVERYRLRVREYLQSVINPSR